MSPRKMSLLHWCAPQQLIVRQHALLQPMASSANGMACRATSPRLSGCRSLQP